MSNDLIRRRVVMELIESKFVDGCLMKGDKTLIDGYGLLDDVSDLPTAYDVEKVVGQLEKCKRIMESQVRHDCYDEECRVGDCVVCAFEKALEIVNAGGIE